MVLSDLGEVPAQRAKGGENGVILVSIIAPEEIKTGNTA